jgi:hypothetical protein
MSVDTRTIQRLQNELKKAQAQLGTARKDFEWIATEWPPMTLQHAKMRAQEALEDLGTVPPDTSDLVLNNEAELRAHFAASTKEEVIEEMINLLNAVKKLEEVGPQMLLSAISELKLAKSEIHQVLEATKPWVSGNPDSSRLDLCHLNACSLRAWGMVIRALELLE